MERKRNATDAFKQTHRTSVKRGGECVQPSTSRGSEFVPQKCSSQALTRAAPSGAVQVSPGTTQQWGTGQQQHTTPAMGLGWLLSCFTRKITRGNISAGREVQGRGVQECVWLPVCAAACHWQAAHIVFLSLHCHGATRQDLRLVPLKHRRHF